MLNSLPIEVLLKQNEDKFSKKEIVIAEYILANLDTSEKLDGKTIAQECQVGFSTLYNLFKKINVKSMKDFLTKVNQEVAAKELINTNSNSSIQKLYLDVLNKNNQLMTKESLHTLIDYIVEANLIYILGIGESNLAAIEMSEHLNRAGFQSFVLGMETNQFATRSALMKDKDLLITISLANQIEHLIPTLRMAKKNGVNIVTITEKLKPPLEKFADFKFHLFTSAFQGNQDVLISPLVPFTFFVDTLMNEISHIDFNQYNNLKIRIAIDIGGITTKIAAIGSNNKIIDLTSFPTNSKDFALTYKHCQRFINKFKKIRLIALSIPGPIDFEGGEIVDPNNLKGWNNLPIIDIFKTDYPNVEIKIRNDARAAALGQYEQFKDLPAAKVLFYTVISVGIGSGLVINGEIYEGINKLAGEVFTTMIDHQEQGFKTPFRGIEYYCSEVGIMQNYPYQHAKNIRELFASQNPEDQLYLDTIASRLASFLATAIGFYNPGLVIVGGPIAENNPGFMTQVFSKTKAITLTLAQEKLEFKVAQNTWESTLIGLVV